MLWHKLWQLSSHERRNMYISRSPIPFLKTFREWPEFYGNSLRLMDSILGWIKVNFSKSDYFERMAGTLKAFSNPISIWLILKYCSNSFNNLNVQDKKLLKSSIKQFSIITDICHDKGKIPLVSFKNNSIFFLPLRLREITYCVVVKHDFPFSSRARESQKFKKKTSAPRYQNCFNFIRCSNFVTFL